MEERDNEKLVKLLMSHDMDDPRFRVRPYQQIASSCIGGMITSLLMTPLDVVKTRLQVQEKKNVLSSKCYLYCNGLMDHICPCNGQIRSTVKLNGTIDAFIKISQVEGVKSLWSGLSPTLVLALPTTVIYFVGYEQLRVRFKEFYLKHTEETVIPFWIPMVAGGSARIIAVTIVNPLELVRTKMQSQHISYFEVGRALKEMVAVQGILGLWKGLTPTIFRDVPFSAIYWSTYERIKSYFGVVTPTFGFSFCSGAAAGSIAAFCTTPFDVIKTHKQIELGEQMLYKNTTHKTNPSTIGAIVDIFRRSGIKGLYAGVVPRLAKVAPACAIMIGTFEYGKAFFFNYNVQRYTEVIKQP